MSWKCFFKNRVIFTCHFIILLAPLISVSRQVDHYMVKCLKVYDGDTILVSFETGTMEKVRLSHIDAPELSQRSFTGDPIGLVAKQRLERKVLGKSLFLRSLGRGYYGRLLAEIWLDQEDISLWLIREGLAILYPFSEFQSSYQKEKYLLAQNRAWSSGFGIFSSDFLSPYYYRKSQKRGKASH